MYKRTGIFLSGLLVLLVGVFIVVLVDLPLQLRMGNLHGGLVPSILIFLSGTLVFFGGLYLMWKSVFQVKTNEKT